MVLIACFIWICNLLKPIKFISSTRLFVLVLLMKAEYRLSYNLISDSSILLVVFLWFHNIFLFSTGYWHFLNDTDASEYCKLVSWVAITTYCILASFVFVFVLLLLLLLFCFLFFVLWVWYCLQCFLDKCRRVHSTIMTPENTELIRKSIYSLVFTLKNIEASSFICIEDPA